MWQSRPIFISSTFADMQAERDYLRTRVFPELEERLRARRHNIEWVDLRVGVATASQRDEHVRELYVLKVCLDEVKRCRPFLIVLLGDRYGWVPPEERIKAAAEEAREGFSADVAGRSVTDLEIEFGVLSDPEQQPRSFFYFREPLPYAEMPKDVAALYCEDYASDPGKMERKARLAALKRRIEARLPGRVERYRVAWDSARQRVSGLEDFGSKVLKHICSELEADTRTSAAAADIPWQQAEREALEDFVDDRARGFVGRRGILNTLTGLANGNDGPRWAACVTGEPGSGKSALFGALYRLLQGRDVFLLAHAAGASVNAPSVDLMLRRWIGELAEALDTDSSLADDADPDTVDATFLRLLGQMAQRQRVVVLVDALDQFERTTCGRYVTWLPRLWPVNARFIATAIAGDASQALAERPAIGVEQLVPLNAAEARDIIGGRSDDGICKGICGRYHRTFEPEVIDALLGKRTPVGPAWANPLWLVLAVEDLNLLDADDFARAQRDHAGAPAERLRALMLDGVAAFPPDIAGLYAHTFKRAEDLFGAKLTLGFLGLIAVSRAGWRESDFRLLLPRASGENWDELQFAQLRRLFRGQLRRRGALAQWDFNHAQMRVAVRARLAAGTISEQSLHTIIADRLLSCPTDDPLHISETMVHLLASEDYPRAAGYYGNVSLSEPEVKGATRVLGDSLAARAYSSNALQTSAHVQSLTELLARAPSDTRVGLVSGDHISPEITVGMLIVQVLLIAATEPSTKAAIVRRFAYDLTPSLNGRVPLDLRVVLCQSINQALFALHSSDPADVQLLQDNGRNLMEAAELLQRTPGGAEQAVKMYAGLASFTERQLAADPGNLEYRFGLSEAYYRMGEALGSQGLMADTIAAFRKGQSFIENLPAERHNDLWHWQMIIGHDGISAALSEIGQNKEAIDSSRKALSVAEKLARSYPGMPRAQLNLALELRRLAGLLASESCHDEASILYDQSLAISERTVATNPDDAQAKLGLATAYRTVGRAVLLKSDRGQALVLHRKALAILEQLAKEDPADKNSQVDLAETQSNIGDVLLETENYEDALSVLRKCLSIREQLVAREQQNVRWKSALASTHLQVGDALRKRRQYDEARYHYQQAIALAQSASLSASHTAGLQSMLATAFRKNGDLLTLVQDDEAAIAAYQNSIAIWQIIPITDSQKSITLQELASCREKLGNILLKTSRPDHALAEYRRTISIIKKLEGNGSASPACRAVLARAYVGSGDALVRNGQYDTALVEYQHAQDIAARLVINEAGRPSAGNLMSVCFNRMGNAHRYAQRPAEALGFYKQALSILKSGQSNVRLDDLEEIAGAWNSVGDTLRELGRSDEALKAFQEMIEQLGDKLAPSFDNKTVLPALASSHGKMADILVSLGRLEEAIQAYKTAISMVRTCAADEPKTWRAELVDLHDKLADTLVLAGRSEEALVAYRESISIREEIAAEQQ